MSVGTTSVKSEFVDDELEELELLECPPPPSMSPQRLMRRSRLSVLLGTVGIVCQTRLVGFAVAERTCGSARAGYVQT